MKTNRLVTIVLLVFVAVSLGTIVAKNLRHAPGSSEATAQPVLSDGVIAYYFHSNTRCPTCDSIESYTREALQSGFGDEMKSGHLQWRVLNYEKPENEHFVKEFQIALPSVVLVKMAGGKQVAWKNLDQVWPLVGDKPAFLAYVQKEAKGVVEGDAK